MEILTQKHNFIAETKFRAKTFLLITKRFIENKISPLQKFPVKKELINESVISFSESDLWNKDDNEQNWILTAGKIENLRIAAKKLNGIEISANKPFSFWKHIGNPNEEKGYVVGREIREGCIVPTIAGGLCQLSNALYDAALKAGFEIIERHKHTKIIKGSLAEQDRDATVKWNYLDLRFKSNKAFRIEIEITSDKLIVIFKATEKENEQKNIFSNSFQSSKLNDCYSCGNTACFKHPDKKTIKKESAITTFILDDRWSEYGEYIKSIATDKDFFIIPITKNKFIKTNRYCWEIPNLNNVRATPFAALQRALKLRFSGKKNIFSISLQYDKKIAKVQSKLIPVESTHVVVFQNFAPFLYDEGVFGGRTFDVLMTRLPIELLHARLDFAKLKHTESKTLDDFRAPQHLIDLENTTLTKAKKIITPHQEIANIFKNKSITLNWHLPAVTNPKNNIGSKILFPASALGRKGAYEIKQLAKELNLCIVIVNKATEDENFWEGITTETANKNLFDTICAVVYPTYIEHQPRVLLKAIAAGVPVITTTASGLAATNNLTIVPIGDYDALKQTVKLVMTTTTKF